LEKPVIGCNIPAVSELIEDGVNGYLVAQQPVEIADSIIRLLTEPNLANSMGAAGKKKVEERYTWQKLAMLTERAYLNLLS
jgi:glycosyltransferase involved in cell wall biosynthesis